MENKTDIANILSLISTQLDNYPEIKAFYTQHVHIPSAVFIPQVIRLAEGELSRNDALVLECICFLETTCIFSLLETGDSLFFYNEVVKLLVNSKTVDDLSKAIGPGWFIFENIESLQTFLTNNKQLISIYIYGMVSKISFKE